MMLFVARLWFEGNRFSPTPTGFAQFRQREWLRGDAALAAARGTATELAAVAAVADRVDREGEGFAKGAPRVVVGRCASASPGGPIDDAVFDAFVAETLIDLDACSPGAIYLSLHGAAITASRDAPELDLLEQVRARCPGARIAVSFDLHANLDARLVSLVDFATAYRTYPHIDMRETAARALAHLAQLAATPSLRWHGAISKLGALVPSFNMRSAVEPMAGLQSLARQAEAAPEIVDTSILGGFPYADTATSDGSVMVWAIDEASAANRAELLAVTYRSRLPAFAPALLDPEAGLRRADALLEQADGRGPIAITDPADNPLSGGGAETTTLFDALLAARLRAGPFHARIAALAPGAIVFAYFNDPGAVAAARELGVGAMLALVLGTDSADSAEAGAADTAVDPRSAVSGTRVGGFGPRVAIDARIVSIGDGAFVNTGPMEQGARVEAGPMAVVEVAGIHVILASSVCAANDPAFFTCNGIDPCSIRLLCVKAKNHFRGAFETICAAIIDVDCPGPAAADLSTLPFRHWGK